MDAIVILEPNGRLKIDYKKIRKRQSDHKVVYLAKEATAINIYKKYQKIIPSCVGKKKPKSDRIPVVITW